MLATYLLGLFLAGIGSVTAQTFTSCDPLNKTCPPDPALGTEHTWYFNTSIDSKIWNVTSGQPTVSNGALQLSIPQSLLSTTMQSNFYINFGVVESWVMMAPGRGVVSSVVLLSDDLDEIDLEWVGYNTSNLQSNYYGKGNTTTYNRARQHYVPNAATEFHNYTTHWTAQKLEWWIDGVLHRTLLYDEALGGKNYPQTPSRVSYSIWAGGAPTNAKGTIEWAGGEINPANAPFTMQVQKVRVHDFGSGKEYVYTNLSGDWQSIESVPGVSRAQQILDKKPSPSLLQKFNALPAAVRIGIYCGAAGLVLLLICIFLFFCVSQRKKGRLEHALEEAKFNSQRTEMLNYQKDWKESSWDR